MIGRRGPGDGASPAARPRAADRRAAILATAQDVFLTHGYAGASMSLIAAQLGGSKATLYSYFSSKAELFRAVAARQSADLQAELFAHNTPDRPAAERLTEFAVRFLSALMQPWAVAFQRMVVAESGRFPELGRNFFETGPREVRAEIARILAPMMWRGELRSADPEAAADVFADLLISGGMLRRLWSVDEPPTEAAVAARVAFVVELFVRAYSPAGTETGMAPDDGQ